MGGTPARRRFRRRWRRLRGGIGAWVAPCSEREGLEVDSALRNARALEFGGEPVRQGVGTAQVDLAGPQVGDDLAQRARVEAHLIAGSDELEETAAAAVHLAG